MEKTTPQAVTRIEYLPSDRPDVWGLALTFADRSEHIGALGAEGLGLLLTQSLELARNFSDLPDLAIENWSGPTHSLPASHIEFLRGRHAKEFALRISLGKVNLFFLVDMAQVIEAMAQVASQIEPDPNVRHGGAN